VRQDERKVVLLYDRFTTALVPWVRNSKSENTTDHLILHDGISSANRRMKARLAIRISSAISGVKSALNRISLP
jgi:hypothetical protein